MEIIQDFIPDGRRNRPGYSMTPVYITIHDTGNIKAGADTLGHASYLKSDTAANLPASWHFTVDDKRVVQHLPLNENGWHASDGGSGPGNRTSIGIEICENSDGNRTKAEQKAAELVAWLLKEYNLGIDRVVQHAKWASRNCPRVLRGRPGGWEGFLAQVTYEGMQIEGNLSQEILTPITGQAVATKQQARAWLEQKAPEWTLMADLYYSIAPKYNIRADVALAQACKETGYFRFGGLVQPWQNNFAGIGATGTASDGSTPLRGASPDHVRFEKGVHGAIFVDRTTGVEAHIQHLYAYATTNDLPDGTILYSPRFTLVRRGSASYVEHLGAGENPTGVGWAYPGVDYGQSIVKDYLTGLLVTPDPVVPDPTSDLQREIDQLIFELEKVKKERDAYKATLLEIRKLTETL